jgi:ABC-type branched-subunit amino acid transport system ATPase component
MTDPIDFSVPEELLRVSTERDRARTRLPLKRVDAMARGVGLLTASTAMLVGLGAVALVVLLVAIAASVVVGRAVVEVTPAKRRRRALVSIAGSVLAGAGGGLVAASAVDEAQGQGFVVATSIAAATAGAVLLVVAFRAAHGAAASTDGNHEADPTVGAALEVRDLDFAYGSHQVLFGVSLTVAEGEIAALLGTNGAGKSTILRAVSGLDTPVAGTIRLFGEDTTYTEAEEVVRMGVALLAGGRMTFPSLTVEENLRVGAFSMKDNTPIEDVYRRFPALAERRQQRAGTLSGGEQQMLALGRVLLTKPRLLLIDELTLGLAPKVVEDLIAIVREVNAEGTTVLLVEQSANLALALAAHAFFLERGEVRFDGPTAELLRRDDLLRPVFLNDVGP